MLDFPAGQQSLLSSLQVNVAHDIETSTHVFPLLKTASSRSKAKLSLSSDIAEVESFRREVMLRSVPA